MGCITADHASCRRRHRSSSSRGPSSNIKALLFMLSDCWHQPGDFAVAEFPFSLSIWGCLCCSHVYYVFLYWELLRVLSSINWRHIAWCWMDMCGDALTQAIRRLKEKVSAAIGFFSFLIFLSALCGNEDVIWWENEVSLGKSAACTRAPLIL